MLTVLVKNEVGALKSEFGISCEDGVKSDFVTRCVFCFNFEDGVMYVFASKVESL